MGDCYSSCFESPDEKSKLLRPRRVFKFNYKEVDQHFLRYLISNVGNNVVFITTDKRVALTAHGLQSGVYLLDRNCIVKVAYH